MWAPQRVGSTIGGSFGFAILVLIAFRSHGFQLLYLFTSGLFGLISLGVLAAAGAAIGLILAKVKMVPPLPPIRTLTIALVVALGPLTAGFVEIALRDDPLGLPADAQRVEWKRWPWGERVLTFETALGVEEIHDQLVQSAKKDGWVCRYCQFQPSTGSGHASFRAGGANPNKQGGSLGFEVWHGQKASYGLQPSDLTQVRVFSRQRTLSVEWTLRAVTVFLFVGVILHLRRSAQIQSVGAPSTNTSSSALNEESGHIKNYKGYSFTRVDGCVHVDGKQFSNVLEAEKWVKEQVKNS